MHQAVGAEGHRFESPFEGAHVHHGGEPLGVRGRDDRGDGLPVERGDLHAEGAAVLVDDLDPVGALRLARPHPLRGLLRAGKHLHGYPVLRAVAIRGGRGHAGGEEVRLGASLHLFARGSPRGGEGRRRGLVQHRGHAETQRVVQRREKAVHVAIDPVTTSAPSRTAMLALEKPPLIWSAFPGAQASPLPLTSPTP